MDTVPVTARADLTDAQWAVLEPLLPKGKKPGRPPKWSKRQLIDGIRWRCRVGSPWRGVPPQYGPWQTAYGLFRRWQRDGTWPRVLTGLQARADAAGLTTWDVSVDSTIARAHQHAAGAPKRGDLQKEPPAAWLVSSRPTTAWGARGAGRSGRPRTRPDRVLGDKAYSPNGNRAYLRRRRIRGTIPVKEDQAANRRKLGSHGGGPPTFDTQAYKLRHAVECGINLLKQHRGVAARFDKLAVRYEATVQVAAINIWLRCLERSL